LVVQRGVAGRTGVLLAIAPSTPPQGSPGRAAGGPRRGFVPQTQATYQLLKHAPSPPRSYVIRDVNYVTDVLDPLR